MTTDYSVRSDFVIPTIVRDQMYRSWMEKLDVFNAASQGALVLGNDAAATAIGENPYTARFYQLATSVDARLDTTEDEATTPADITALTQATGCSVIQGRTIGPVGVGIDAIVTGKASREAVSMNIGRQFADLQMIALRNNLIAAGVAAIQSADTTDGSTASANIHMLEKWAQTKTASSKVTLTTGYLAQLLYKMGDAAENIKVWVMPSTCYYDLLADQIANFKIDTVAGMAIAEGSARTLGRPVIVADVPALSVDATSSYYDKAYVLGLGAGALQANIRHDTGVMAWDRLETKQPIACARQDYWVEFSVLGMKWVPGSIHSPTDAQLATASNWDEDYKTHKEVPIVMGTFNISAS